MKTEGKYTLDELDKSKERSEDSKKYKYEIGNLLSDEWIITDKNYLFKITLIFNTMFRQDSVEIYADRIVRSLFCHRYYFYCNGANVVELILSNRYEKLSVDFVKR
jgi:hypothetical protein